MKKQFIVLSILLLLIFYIYPEKWVGQIATYNLIEGTTTADGQVFNADNMTAACNGFRLGAKVKVTNVKTGQQIEVLITDRITNDSNYFMLLSPKAAKELGLPWETSLAVIDAKFSDVNSTEILPISGLVAEGTVDKENFKQFPEIKWPDGDNSITKLTVEKNPKDDLLKKPIQKDNVLLDTDKSDTEKTPNTQKDKNPEKIMQNYKLDADSEENLVPDKELSKIPNIKEKALDEDKADKLTPKNDSIKSPQKNKNLIDTEQNDNPKKLITEKPDTRKNAIDNDTNIQETVKTNPNEEYAKLPLTKENQIDIDKEDIISPKKETLTNPDKNKTKIDEDNKLIVKIDNTKNVTETNKENIQWVTSLPKGEIYIRFSATFEKTEGERRLSIFKDIFKNVVGLKENNKYILLVGPVAKKDIDKILKGIRDFGYKDAYLIQK
jgi:rare lipoprotein A (peptidoglycan hydrolase)